MENFVDHFAHTEVPIHPLLASRYSTRAFDPAFRLEPQQVTALIEAARWAPSARNTQPWRFLIAHADTTAFKQILSTLVTENIAWAQYASAFIVAGYVDSAGFGHADYELGGAVAHMTFQASAEGLSARHMSGFDADLLRQECNVPAEVTIRSIVAVGISGSTETLPEEVIAEELLPRTRLSLSHILL